MVSIGTFHKVRVSTTLSVEGEEGLSEGVTVGIEQRSKKKMHEKGRGRRNRRDATKYSIILGTHPFFDFHG